MPEPVAFTPPIQEVRRGVTPGTPVLDSPPIGGGGSSKALLELEQRLAQAKDSEVKAAPLPLPGPKDGELEELSEVPPLPVRTGTPWLDDPRLRQGIEARCEPLNFEELVVTGKVSQKVPIRAGKLEVVYQTLGGDDEIFIAEQADLKAGRTPNLLRVYTIMELSLGIQAVNGRVLPNIVNDKGERDPELFEARWKRVSKYAVELLQLFALNFVWFRERVGRLTVLDDLGNG